MTLAARHVITPFTERLHVEAPTPLPFAHLPPTLFPPHSAIAAQFGGSVAELQGRDPLPLLLASPRDACSPLDGNLTGSVALVTRGGLQGWGSQRVCQAGP
jgi:hypothetical protein